ncbi:hypothetical protein [Nitrobacter sp. TKz-YC01]|uniref:hypothetical protein n=1 Tax=Nitrobacter sp. TKz-YC01 TaxID=3398703 RepID=UPI003A10306D
MKTHQGKISKLESEEKLAEARGLSAQAKAGRATVASGSCGTNPTGYVRGRKSMSY